MKILVLPKYHREGPSSRYRYYNYFPSWLANGYSVTAKPLLYDGYVADLNNAEHKLKRTLMFFYGILKRVIFLLTQRRKFDVIIIEKELVTFMPYFLEKLLLRKCTVILDYDDNINARYQQGFWKFFLSDKILKMAGLATAITVGNHWYEEFYQTIDQSKIHYFPTVVDHALYVDRSVREKKEHLEIVWIGSSSTVRYLQSVDEILADLQKQYNFKLKVIGAKIRLNCAVDFVEWSAHTEIDELLAADIGIMPLEDTDWEKGKCGFKLIQYMASGLPVVASFSVANNEIIQQDCGYIAKTLPDWTAYLSLLLTSTELRNSMGQHGRERICNFYSYKTWEPRFSELLNNIYQQHNAL